MTSHREEECLTCVEIIHFRQVCHLSWDELADRLGVTPPVLGRHVWFHKPCGDDLPTHMERRTPSGSWASADALRMAAAEILGCTWYHFRTYYGATDVARYVVEHGCLPPDIPLVPYVARRLGPAARAVKNEREKRRSADITRAAHALGMPVRQYRVTHGYSWAKAKAFIAAAEAASCAD